MNDEKLKLQLGANIAAYRKHFGMTQVGLAKKLNYSDKAVSKWERGESMPDVLTLVQLAELYEVTVDDLLADPNALPEPTTKVEMVVEKAVERTLKRKADKTIVLGLTSALVWFLALLSFVVLSSVGLSRTWMAFIYAIPTDAIVMLGLRSAWRDFRRNKILVSAIVWSGLLAIYMSLLVFAGLNIWKVFLLGVPGQVAIFLWFRLFRTPNKEKQNG